MSSIATTLALLSVTTAPAVETAAPVAEPAPVSAPEAASDPAPEAAPAAAPEAAPVAAPEAAAAVTEPMALGASAPEPAPVVVAEQPVAAPAAQPRVSPPMIIPPPTTPANWQPERPKAMSGRGLVWTSIGLGAASWGLTLGQVGMIRGCAARLDGDLEFTADECLYEDSNVAALGGLKALTNVANWGVSATAGAIKGNYDAIDHVWIGRAPRRSGLWIGGGIGLALAGMTTGAIAASMTFRDGASCSAGSCNANLAAYLIAGQTAQTMFTAGVGMMAYGMVYHYEYRDNLSYKNRLATMRAAPVVTADFAGASLSGRF